MPTAFFPIPQIVVAGLVLPDWSRNAINPQPLPPERALTSLGGQA
jgi:hypothetical protein